MVIPKPILTLDAVLRPLGATALWDGRVGLVDVGLKVAILVGVEDEAGAVA